MEEGAAWPGRSGQVSGASGRRSPGGRSARCTAARPRKCVRRRGGGCRTSSHGLRVGSWGFRGSADNRMRKPWLLRATSAAWSGPSRRVVGGSSAALLSGSSQADQRAELPRAGNGNLPRRRKCNFAGGFAELPGGLRDRLTLPLVVSPQPLDLRLDSQRCQTALVVQRRPSWCSGGERRRNRLGYRDLARPSDPSAITILPGPCGLGCVAAAARAVIGHPRFRVGRSPCPLHCHPADGFVDAAVSEQRERSLGAEVTGCP
jgi:hypothetical protein